MQKPDHWSKVRIHPAPNGDFHMPHCCACCGEEGALRSSPLSVRDGKQNINVPVWYCMLCSRHQERAHLFKRAAIGLSAATMLACDVYLLRYDWLARSDDPRALFIGLGIPALAGLAVLGMTLMLGGLLAMKLTDDCTTRGPAVNVDHRASRAALTEGFVLRTSNPVFAKLITTLNRGAMMAEIIELGHTHDDRNVENPPR